MSEDHHIHRGRRTLLTRRSVLLTAAGLAGASAAPRAMAAEATPDDVSGATIMITGSNRGLGLEFARQYARRGAAIIATCRNPDKADELRSLQQDYPDLEIVKLDVTDHGQIDAVAADYSERAIDILINNAGIGGGQENQIFGELRYPVFDQVMAVNVKGPIKMSEAFTEHVARSRLSKIITVSSSQGSIASVRFPTLYWYRSSKSAVNMLMRNLAFQLKPRDIIVGLVTPGATATDFIPKETQKMIASIRQPEQATADMIRNIDGFTLENTGTFFDYDGSVMPW